MGPHTWVKHGQAAANAVQDELWGGEGLLVQLPVRKGRHLCKDDHQSACCSACHAYCGRHLIACCRTWHELLGACHDAQRLGLQMPSCKLHLVPERCDRAEAFSAVRTSHICQHVR